MGAAAASRTDRALAVVAVTGVLIAQAFDELLLLKRGGRTIYCGPLGRQSADLIAYFQVSPQFTHQLKLS